ncbi:unnamed protein product, partial [marine sediment metagenome]
SKSKDDDNMTIKIGSLRIKTYFRDNIEVGSEIWISVRFENISLIREKKAGPDNVFSGTVKNFIFLGPLAKYDIKVSGLNELVSALVPINSSFENYFKVGDKIFISWDKYNCNLLFR